MLCQNCGKNEANIRYTQIINGVKKEVALCSNCAKKLGMDEFEMPISFHSLLGDFFNDYACEMGRKQKVKKNAKEIIDRLKDEENSIYIITARSDRFYKDVNKYVKEFLDENNIKYDKIITSCFYKVDVCKNEKIDIMFDDAIDTCESLCNNGIDAVVFNSKLNISKDTKCKRVNSWDEVYNYIKNCKIKN